MLKKIKKLATIFIFLLLNKKIHQKNDKVSNKIILVEFNNWALLHVAKYLIFKYFLKKYKCKIYSYEGYTLISSKNKISIPKLIVRFLMIKFNIGTYGIYKFFGVSKFLRPKITEKIKLEASKILKTNRIESRTQLYNLKIKNIHFGDLIYDNYLKVFNKPTVNLKTKDFEIFFYDIICLILYWFYFFKKYKKKILNVLFIHEVYSYGIVPRLALNFGVESTKISHKSLIKFKKKSFYIGQENSFYYKNFFKKKTSKYKSLALKYSNNILKKISKKILIEKSNSKEIKKILIYCHSLKDSPHVFGNFFYNDFHEWLISLSRISKKTNYEWLIKPHPDDEFIEKNYFSEIKKKFKNAHILPTKLKKKIKVDLALTCFGTAGYELPYKGIKVINCSKNHPHKDFNFCITPTNKKNYENLLLNLKRIKRYKIDKSQILEFYFIKRYHLYVDWMKLKLNKSQDINDKIIKKYYEPTFYDQFYKTMTIEKIKKIDKTISNFYNDKKNIILSNFH